MTEIEKSPTPPLKKRRGASRIFAGGLHRGMAVLLALFLLLPANAQAYIGLCCAHCGGNMPLNIFGGGIPEPKEFRFKISQMFMRMGPMRDGTRDLKTSELVGMPAMGKFPAVPESMNMWMTMFGGAYSFSDDFALMLMSSFRYNTMPMRFNAMLQASTGRSGFTMESSGLGDTKLIGKYRLYSDDHLAPTQQVSMLFGVSLPTGSIKKEFTENPAAGQNGTLLPFKMQMGSGTFDPIVGLTYQGSRDPFWYGANLVYTGRFYDNSQDYQQGDEVRLDLYSMYQFHPQSVVHLQLNGFYEGRYSDEPRLAREQGHGHVGFNPNGPFTSPLFDPDNYGGTKLNVTAGIQYQPIPLHVLELTASAPVTQNLRGPQLAEDYRIMISYYIEIPTKDSRRYKGMPAPKELGF
ncbi:MULTISPECIES: transporter [unclassified Nitrospina]|uniref:transporter n=1 Tax=unclassified Nitrospina TaxID=2638683 RepID=UPI003F964A6F